MITAWAALESMAARLTCERASDAEIASLRALFDGFEHGDLRLRLNEYSAANFRFHQRVMELGHRRCWWTWPMPCSCTCGRSAAA